MEEEVVQYLLGFCIGALTGFILASIILYDGSTR